MGVGRDLSPVLLCALLHMRVCGEQGGREKGELHTCR